MKIWYLPESIFFSHYGGHYNGTFANNWLSGCLFFYVNLSLGGYRFWLVLYMSGESKQNVRVQSFLLHQ